MGNAQLTDDPVRTRLLKAARECFLADDYHKVTTRGIAQRAKANISMIRYYFGSKEGLYEEMLREVLNPLLDAVDGPVMSSVAGLSDFLRLYYRTMWSKPEFPKLILKILALKQGPGRRFIKQMLERGRTRAAGRVKELKQQGQLAPDVDADILRLSFLSLAMMPMLLKDVFEEQLGRPMDDDFMDKLAAFNGTLFTAGLAQAKHS